MEPYRTLAVSAALTLGLALVACETEGDETTSEGTPPAGGEGVAVEVVLTDFAIDMPATVPAGTVSFDVSNAGEMAHNFEVEGEGIEETLDEDLDPNQSTNLTVELEPGTYTVYCPIGDHREQGMEVQLEVTDS